MKALTLHQPWATLIALGKKRYETRSWATGYRGRIAIHAGKSWGPEQRELVQDIEPFRSVLAGVELPRGVVLATATLTECVPTEELRSDVTDEEYAFGDFSPGRYGWFLEDVRRLWLPIEARGYQGLWTPDPALRKQILEHLEAS